MKTENPLSSSKSWGAPAVTCWFLQVFVGQEKGTYRFCSSFLHCKSGSSSDEWLFSDTQEDQTSACCRTFSGNRGGGMKHKCHKWTRFSVAVYRCHTGNASLPTLPHFGFHGEANKSSAPPQVEEPEEKGCVRVFLTKLTWTGFLGALSWSESSTTSHVHFVCVCECVHTLWRDRERGKVLEGGESVSV